VTARAAVGAAVATCASLGALALWPDRSHAIVAAWALAMLTWGLLRAVGGARLLTSGRSEFDKALATPAHRPVRPEDLARCERIFGWKAYPARDFDHHVRPLLRELLEHRVGEAARSGAVLELGPELRALSEGAGAEASFGAVVATEDVERIIRGIEEL
jgi:hypothetical protein